MLCWPQIADLVRRIGALPNIQRWIRARPASKLWSIHAPLIPDPLWSGLNKVPRQIVGHLWSGVIYYWRSRLPKLELSCIQSLSCTLAWQTCTSNWLFGTTSWESINVVGFRLIFSRKDYGTCPWWCMFENAKKRKNGFILHIRRLVFFSKLAKAWQLC